MNSKSKREILKDLVEVINGIAEDDNGCDFIAVIDMAQTVDPNQSIRAESTTHEGRSIKRTEIIEFIKTQRAAYAKSKFKERGVEGEHAMLLVATSVDNIFLLYASESPGEYQNLKMMSSFERSRVEGFLAALAS